MKLKYYILGVAGLMLGMSSCVEDKGSYDKIPVNEVNVSGLEGSYSVIAGVTQLQIQPTVEGTLSGSDDSQYEYLWYACTSELGSDIHEHTVLGTEKNLDTTVDLAPGTYNLYLIITDKSTGLEWIASRNVTLTVQTVLSRGFYVFGDKEDGTVGIDFLSMPEGGDSLIVKDIFVNEQGMKGAEDLIFSGYNYSTNGQNLWAVTNTGTSKITSLISESSLFYVDPYYNEGDYFFPTLDVQRPLKIVDQFPHQISGGRSASSSSRGYITEDAVFVASIITGESFGNPINRYDATSVNLFKPYKMAFYQGESSYLRAIMLYDMDDNCFCVIPSSMWTSQKNCKKLTDKAGDLFPWNQTDRTIVYGENTSYYYSYALMKDLKQSGQYYIYMMYIASYISPSKYGCFPLNVSNVSGLDEATNFAFFSQQSMMLYSVGSKLYGINYGSESNKAVLLKDFGSEITHLAFDYISRGSYTDFVVCTYDNTNKGTIYKYEINNNPNTIEIRPLENCEWKTDLKVKKLEYRNCSF